MRRASETDKSEMWMTANNVRSVGLHRCPAGTTSITSPISLSGPGPAVLRATVRMRIEQAILVPHEDLSVLEPVPADHIGKSVTLSKKVFTSV